MSVRIFIPQPIPHSATERLRDLGSVEVFPETEVMIPRDRLLASVVGIEVLVALGHVPYDAEVIAAADSLRLIAAMHMTALFVDHDAATARGVPVTGIPTGLTATTAEFTVALLLATAWRIPEADRYLRQGRWGQKQSMALMGTRMMGKMLGIVGLGAVGREVARRLMGFDLEVIYHNPSPVPAEDERSLGVRYVGLDKLFAESDFVVLTPSLTRETAGLVGDRLLGLMKPEAIVVNTSRGRVVEEEALERALRDGRIRGAGLDVFEREVPQPDAGPGPGLLDLPNVVATPHIGSAARETREEMAHQMVDNVEAFLEGRRPPNVLNPEVYGEPRIVSDRIG